MPWTRIKEVYKAGPRTFVFVAFYTVTSILAIFSVTLFGFYEPNGVDIFSPPLQTPPVDILALSGMDDEKSKFRSEFEGALAGPYPVWRQYTSTEAAFYSWGLRRLYFTDSGERDILYTLRLGSRYASCAVVGNLGRIMNAGHEIDSHHAVIRLDDVNITGNHENLGRKTTVSVGSIQMLLDCAFNPHMKNPNRYGFGTRTVVYIPDEIVHSIPLISLCEMTRNSEDILLTDPRFDLLSRKIAKYYSLKRFFKDNNRTIEGWNALYGKFRYSSGLQAVILAYVSCQKISLYGLQAAKTNQRMPNYDYEAEMDFYRDLSISKKRIPFLNKFDLDKVEVQIN